MGLKVLLVDDDAFSIFLHSRIVKISGLAAEPAQFLNGKSALDYLKEESNEEDFYLILLDINMPIMDGWEFLDELRTQLNSDRIFVVMVTSSLDNMDRDRAFQSGYVIDFVSKPLDEKACKQIMLLPQLKEYF